MRNSIYILISLVLLILVSVLSFYINQSDEFSLFNLTETDVLIVNQIRIPRLVTGLIVGGGLALSGYLLQNLTNNALADPYLIGTAGGASLGANLVISGIASSSLFHLASISLSAVLVALGVTLIILKISYEKGQLSVFRLLLAGIAFTSLTGAINAVIIYTVGDANKVSEIIFWSMGSLAKSDWSNISIMSIALVASLIIVFVFRKELQMMLLGQERAFSLGVNVEKVKWTIVIVSTVLTAICVAFVGPIGFVGLFVPHFIRSVFGSNGALNVIFVVLIGGGFLVTCDVIGRLVYPPVGLPIGVITSIIGIPFFIWLVVKSNYRF